MRAPVASVRASAQTPANAPSPATATRACSRNAGRLGGATPAAVAPNSCGAFRVFVLGINGPGKLSTGPRRRRSVASARASPAAHLSRPRYAAALKISRSLSLHTEKRAANLTWCFFVYETPAAIMLRLDRRRFSAMVFGLPHFLST